MSHPAEATPPAKCHLCLYKTKPSGPLLASAAKEPALCRHQHHHNRMRSKYLRFPMIGVEQKSFDDAKYYVHQDGLYFSNRKVNKSLSNITDLFGGGHPLDRSDDAVFGERVVFKSQRPNSLVVNNDAEENPGSALRRTTSKGTIDPSPYVRQLSVPNGESEEFRDFVGSASPRSSGSGSLPRRNQCDVCGVCNQTRCSSNGGESTGRFTITTLSRSEHLPGSQASTLKNRTLPRNGGVFVAVGNWTTTTAADDNHRPLVVARPNNAASSTSDVSYYEVLKNPNANNNQPLYETPITMLQPQQQQHLYENHQPQMPVSTKCEPIYAVVNKMNKTRHHRSFEQPSTGYADDQMYASIGHYGNNNRRFAGGGRGGDALDVGSMMVGNGLTSGEDNNGGGGVDDVDGCAASTQLKSSHITITSSVDEPGSDTSDIYAKVWKGPRKSLDSQKMM